MLKERVRIPCVPAFSCLLDAPIVHDNPTETKIADRILDKLDTV